MSESWLAFRPKAGEPLVKAAIPVSTFRRVKAPLVGFSDATSLAGMRRSRSSPVEEILTEHNRAATSRAAGIWYVPH
jgi:hypothetical protein